MKLRTFLIAGVSMLFGLGVAIAAIGATKPATEEGGKNSWSTPQMIGRYQMVPMSGVCIHVCDTTTGEVWTTNNDGVWTAKGKPPYDRL